MWKLPASRTFICGIGKRFYGISGSSNIGGAEEQGQQQVAVNFMMQAIEEKILKIVQMREKEYGQQKMDVAKMVSEQCQKQMAKQNATIEELEVSFWEQKRMALKFNANLNEFERQLKSIQDQQGTMDIKFGNPIGNVWKRNYWNGLFNNKCTISPDGLEVNTYKEWLNIYAAKGFPIAPKRCGKDKFVGTGTILYYYEVTQMSSRSADWRLDIGLSAGYFPIPTYIFLGVPAGDIYICKFSNKFHNFELSKETKTPVELKDMGNVVGCGILFESMQKLSIFFTLNGILLGKIPMKPSVKCLYPTVIMSNVCMESNFGDNPAKPFKYDIKKCAGLVVE